MVLGGIFEWDQFLWSIGLLGTEDGDEAACKDAHEVTQSDLVRLSLGAFALVKGFEFRGANRGRV